MWDKFLIVSFLGLSAVSADAEMAVPSAREMILQADVIVLGAFQDGGGSRFENSQKFEGPNELYKYVQVASPSSEVGFSLEGFKKQLSNSPVLLLGKWDAGRRVLLPVYGRSSFWPQGVPVGYLPSSSLDEIVRFVRSAPKRLAPKEDGPVWIRWETAVAHIKSGKVMEVYQSHDLDVGLVMEDKRLYRTVEPRIDEAIRVVREMAPNKDAIRYLTE